MNKPKISVIMPSYNHRDFVGEAIESVLMQDFKDYEFLIADDCSKDDSVEVISKYEDPRIKHFFLKNNIGPTQILKLLIENAQGEYIALINSDDCWHNEKLSKQIEYLDNNADIAACFTWADFIDENGNVLGDECDVNVNTFIEKNKTRAEWVNWFFHNGNCLCHPSVLIRKSVYDDIGYYNDVYRQLPDFEFWVRLVGKYAFHIIEEPLVDHRRTTGENSNTSASTTVNNLRLLNEGISIASKLIKEIDDETFVEAFKNEFRCKEASQKEDLIIEKYFLLRDNKMFGDALKNVANLFFMENADEKLLIRLKEGYGYTFKDFFNDNVFSVNGIAQLTNTFTPEAMAFYTNDNFVPEKSIRITPEIEEGKLVVSLVLPEDSRFVRIDPVENAGITVKNATATVDGENVEITPVNAVIGDKQYFTDIDPQYLLSGDFKKGSMLECVFDVECIIDYKMYSPKNDQFNIMHYPEIQAQLLNKRQTEKDELIRLNERIVQLEQEKARIIADYENSASWKITKPLRKIKNMLK